MYIMFYVRSLKKLSLSRIRVYTYICTYVPSKARMYIYTYESYIYMYIRTYVR